jgi:hypothetical protein
LKHSSYKTACLRHPSARGSPTLPQAPFGRPAALNGQSRNRATGKGESISFLYKLINLRGRNAWVSGYNGLKIKHFYNIFRTRCAKNSQ